MPYALGVHIGRARVTASSFELGSEIVCPVLLVEGATTFAVRAAEDATVSVGADAVEGDDLSSVLGDFVARVGDPIPMVVAGLRAAPEAVFAIVARWAVERAAEQFAGMPDSVTITHPSAWGEYRSGLVRAALDEQGLADAQLASVAAAATAEHRSNSPLALGSTIGILDLESRDFTLVTLGSVPGELATIPGPTEPAWWDRNEGSGALSAVVARMGAAGLLSENLASIVMLTGPTPDPATAEFLSGELGVPVATYPATALPVSSGAARLAHTRLVEARAVPGRDSVAVAASPLPRSLRIPRVPRLVPGALAFPTIPPRVQHLGLAAAIAGVMALAGTQFLLPPPLQSTAAESPGRNGQASDRPVSEEVVAETAPEAVPAVPETQDDPPPAVNPPRALKPRAKAPTPAAQSRGSGGSSSGATVPGPGTVVGPGSNPDPSPTPDPEPDPTTTPDPIPEPDPTTTPAPEPEPQPDPTSDPPPTPDPDPTEDPAPTDPDPTGDAAAQ